MYYLNYLKKKIRNHFFDHPHQKEAVTNIYIVIVTLVSAFVFSFGFKCFIQPNYSAFVSSEIANDSTAIHSLASSGASGVSQIVLIIFKLVGTEFILDPFNQYVVNFVTYFCVNIPLLIYAWFKIGKKFSIITLLNVAAASIFGIIIPNDTGSIVQQISEYVYLQPVARILFAGMCTGFASASAYLVESAAGGTDIVAYYISEKKSSGVGKFSALLNLVLVTIYSILSTISSGLVDGEHFSSVLPSTAFVIFLYTLLYMIVVSLVVDTINTTNQKRVIQIFSKDDSLPQVIMANIPHGCTVIKGSGGYTGRDILMITVTVRKSEVKKVIKVARTCDPNCFINAIKAEQVYGRFFRKPIQ